MTKITVDIDGVVASWETEESGCTTTELLRAFNGLLVAHTFHPESVKRSMEQIAAGTDE